MYNFISLYFDAIYLSNSSQDWSIATGSTTLPKVIASLNRWYTGTVSCLCIGFSAIDRILQAPNRPV